MLPASEQPEVMGEFYAASAATSALRRAFDILSAGVGLILLSPLLAIVALAIKVDDRGPVFYRQARIGRNFRPFRLWKFRSMVTGADRNGLITAPGDSRLTRVGRQLRHYKLDELPQLFNVLMGDMQFVGPRPEVQPYVEMFHAQYAVLLQDRPGITDPASLAYRHEDQMLAADRLEQQYVEEILPAKLQLALAYQKRRTLWSDACILLRTVLGLID